MQLLVTKDLHIGYKKLIKKRKKHYYPTANTAHTKAMYVKNKIISVANAHKVICFFCFAATANTIYRLTETRNSRAYSKEGLHGIKRQHFPNKFSGLLPN